MCVCVCGRVGGGGVKYFTSIPKIKLQCDKFNTLNHKCIVMLLVLKNDHEGIFCFSEFKFNNTYNFHFIFDYLYIICQFFFFLHPSLHTPYVKAGALFMIHRIRVFYSLEHWTERFVDMLLIENITVLHLKGIINETRLTLAHIFHESLVP